MNQTTSETRQHKLGLGERVDARRLAINNRLDPNRRIEYGQFMTPSDIAQFMASLFGNQEFSEIRLLDAGSGIGSLTAAFIEGFCRRRNRPNRIAVTAYELDPIMAEGWQATLVDCQEICDAAGIALEAELIQADFIEAGVNQLLADLGPLFPAAVPPGGFTHAILNPPYKKIDSISAHRLRLRHVGIETSNIYSGFLAVAIKLLAPGGELVAITPRSFCNGPYFKPFRDLLLDEMSLGRIHTFESRTHAFKEDEVLQENIIFHATKHQPQGQVTISASENADFSLMSIHTVDFSEVVHPHDPDRFIHVITNERNLRLIERMNALPFTLQDLGIDVSTGPVVDFRLKPYLRKNSEPGTVPLIYPVHFQDCIVVWPAPNGKKPNAIVDAEAVRKWLYPNGYYTVVRRFSSKEERRRVVAAVHDPSTIPGDMIGFENHLNVFHRDRQGLTPELARGLAVYLNSTFFDICFRQFNGHTQVNVKDLYSLRYPDLAQLERLGERVKALVFPSQATIDAWIEEELSLCPATI